MIDVAIVTGVDGVDGADSVSGSGNGVVEWWW